MLFRSKAYSDPKKIESNLEEISKEKFEEAEKETPYGLWWLKHEKDNL